MRVPFAVHYSLPTLRSLLVALLLLLAASTASATPVDQVTVDEWRTTDGNFQYSLLHSATSSSNVGGFSFGTSGSFDYFVDPTGILLADDLTNGVLTNVLGTVTVTEVNNGPIVGTLQLSSDSLDFGVGAGGLIGTLDYVLSINGQADETGSFWFYNYQFTSNGSCNANDLCASGDGTFEYRLWGNNWDNKSEGPGTAPRGIDLGGTINLIPEPSSTLLFPLGGLIAGALSRRRR